jgi:hypothetical protein
VRGRREGGREGGGEGYLLGLPKATELLHDNPGVPRLLVPCQEPAGRLEEERGAEELEAGEKGGNGEEEAPALCGGEGVGQDVWREGGREGGREGVRKGRREGGRAGGRAGGT